MIDRCLWSIVPQSGLKISSFWHYLKPCYVNLSVTVKCEVLFSFFLEWIKQSQLAANTELLMERSSK